MSKSEKRTRSKQVLIRLTAEEHADLAAKSDQMGLTMADYVRSCATQSAHKIKAKIDIVALREVAWHVGRIGGNLNQIAKAMNRGLAAHVPEIERTLLAVREMQSMVMAVLGVDPTGRQQNNVR